MSAERTASDLVLIVRDLLGEVGQNVPFRDGFSTDTVDDTQSVSILRFINLAQRKLSFTGYGRSSETIDVLAATGITANNAYTLNANVIRVTSAYLTNTGATILYPMREMEYDNVDRILPQIRFQPPGLPTAWWSQTNTVLLSPKPLSAYKLVCDTHVTPADMANTLPNAVPLYLPSYFHDALAYGGALLLALMQVDNPAAQRRLDPLQTMYNKFVDELSASCRTNPEPARIRVTPGENPIRVK